MPQQKQEKRPKPQSIPKRQEPVQNDNYFMQAKPDTTRKVSSPKDLLIKFIEVFLPASRRLE